MVEYLTFNQGVEGSSPSQRTSPRIVSEVKEVQLLKKNRRRSTGLIRETVVCLAHFKPEVKGIVSRAIDSAVPKAAYMECFTSGNEVHTAELRWEVQVLPTPPIIYKSIGFIIHYKFYLCVPKL